MTATDSTAQPAVAIWACCSRLALSSLPALIIVAPILSPKSLWRLQTVRHSLLWQSGHVSAATATATLHARSRFSLFDPMPIACSPIIGPLVTSTRSKACRSTFKPSSARLMASMSTGEKLLPLDPKLPLVTLIGSGLPIESSAFWAACVAHWKTAAFASSHAALNK